MRMGMRIKSIATLATLLAIVSVVHAQKTPEPNWVLVSSTDDASYSIDKTSLKRNGNMVTVWESIAMDKRKINAKIFREYDCKDNRQRILSKTIYFKNGDSNSSPVKDDKWDYVIRESVGEQLMVYVCKNAPKGLMDYFK